jgi:uncharacterized membrane protein YhiD involved in acid resistance
MNRILKCGAVIAALATAGEAYASGAIGAIGAIGATEEALAAKVECDAALSLLSMNADRVRAAFKRARAARHTSDVACLDPALSRVDVALRYGREHAQHAAAARLGGEHAAAKDEMQRLSWRVAASRDAMKMAHACGMGGDVVARETGTTVRMWIDPTLPTDVAEYPSR